MKVDKNHTIPSSTWPKPVTKDGQNAYQDIDNVIGILNLPEDLQQDGNRVFLRLRKATEEESVVPCYTDIPPPPTPVYVVLKADNLKCPSDSNP